MNDTAKICREISDSADMGKLALSRLIKRCRDASFCSVMADMFANYHELYNDAQGAWPARFGRKPAAEEAHADRPCAEHGNRQHAFAPIRNAGAGLRDEPYKHCPGGKRMRPRGCKGNVLM